MGLSTYPKIDVSPEVLRSALAKLPADRLQTVSAALAELDRRRVREMCTGRGSFHRFVNLAWPALYPSRRFKDGRVIELMCRAIESTWWGDCQRLLINVPPRTLKSTLLNVFFPAWAWIQDPGHQFLTLSASEHIAVRDSSAARHLITSEWYQKHWGDLFKIRTDENAKNRYSNTKGGYRIAFPIGARLTGEGADTITIDDPHDAKEVKSKLLREGVIEDYTTKIDSRLNDREAGRIVAIMQRLHASDLSGHILENLNKVHFETVILPMEYDGKRYFSNIGLNDWRTKPGELLFPERFSRKAVDQWKGILKIYGTAGQLQQSPSPREGGIIPRGAWRVWTQTKLPPVTDILLSFDLSFKEQEENDPTAFCALGVFEFEETRADHPLFKKPRNGVIVLRAWSRHLRFGQMKQAVLDEQRRFTVEGEPPDEIMIEDKANGPALISELHQIGVRVFGYNPGNASKMDRAILAQDLFDDGLIWVPGKPVLGADYRQDEALPDWAEDMVSEMALFPNGAHDDFVDAVVQGVRRMRDRGDIAVTSDTPTTFEDDDDLPRNAFGELVSPYGAD